MRIGLSTFVLNFASNGGKIGLSVWPTDGEFIIVGIPSWLKYNVNCQKKRLLPDGQIAYRGQGSIQFTAEPTDIHTQRTTIVRFQEIDPVTCAKLGVAPDAVDRAALKITQMGDVTLAPKITPVPEVSNPMSDTKPATTTAINIQEFEDMKLDVELLKMQVRHLMDQAS